MRIPIGVFACGLAGSIVLANAGAEADEWQRMDAGLGDTSFVALALAPSTPAHVFAASQSAVYESADDGQTWQERFRVPARTAISAIAVSPTHAAIVLVATNDGLYASLDGGTHWSRVFRGIGEGQRQCTHAAFHPARPRAVLLGTRGGLFISTDDGRRWTPVGIPAAARRVVSFAFDPGDPGRLYLLATEGLFVGDLDNGRWEQRVGTSQAPEESVQESEGVEPAELDRPPFQLNTVTGHPQQPSTVYLGTTRGVRVSDDRGVTWRWLPASGLRSTNVSRLVVHAHSPAVLYAATDRGVARYDAEHTRWQIITSGQAMSSTKDVIGMPHGLWAATDQGLFRYEIAPNLLEEAEPPTARELLGNFVHEPTIAEVQNAAIRYAEVHPDKIKRWRRQAALQALFPTLNVDMDKDRSSDISVDEGTFPKFQLIETEDRDTSLDFSVKWDLGKLIWNDDQTSIDVRSKLMTQLRDDVVDEVTRTYFERRRLQVKLLTNPPTEQQAMLEQELRLQELTALIDGLTGGAFSGSGKIGAN